MQISFSDYINDIVRILVVLDAVKDRKSLKMTENKIKLYDYYLKFPCTMLGSDLNDLGLKWNFDEYYAFFHWQPDLIRYRQSLNYLVAKGFIERNLEQDSVVYSLCELGGDALRRINNPYKDKLTKLTEIFIPNVAKLSDTKIDSLIREKSNVFLRSGGIRHEG